MKTKTYMNYVSLAACALALTATVVLPAKADPAAAKTRPDRTYTGMVTSIDGKEQLLRVKGWFFSKKCFNPGDNCTYVVPGKVTAGLGDLRVGQKVTVAYQDAHGVLIADRITQDLMRYEGMVKALNPDKHTLTLHRRGSDRTLQIAKGCPVVLRGGKAGTLADLKVGDHVTVTYEKPDDTLMARQIAQTSMTFTGRLTAIDLETRIIKAKAVFESKKFNVADDCAIVIHGQPDGHLADLRPDEKLTFSYDAINGVNVANRIAPADGQTAPATTNAPVAAD